MWSSVGWQFWACLSLPLVFWVVRRLKPLAWLTKRVRRG